MAKLEHGESVVSIKDNIIDVKCIGNFNQHGVETYIQKVKGAIADLDNKPFAMLVDNLSFEGGTPEAFQLLDEYNYWLGQQPIAAKAFIINNIVNKSILIKRTPALQSQTVEFFQDKDAATRWLQQQLSK